MYSAALGVFLVLATNAKAVSRWTKCFLLMLLLACAVYVQTNILLFEAIEAFPKERHKQNHVCVCMISPTCGRASRFHESRVCYHQLRLAEYVCLPHLCTFFRCRSNPRLPATLSGLLPSLLLNELPESISDHPFIHPSIRCEV